MKLFMQYLRQKWRVLAAFTLFAAVLAVCFALYRLSLRAVWYPLALCAALGLSLLTADFLRLRRRHETLCRLRAAPDPEAPIRLEQPKILYQYADPNLENRSAGQKIMMRIGRNNAAVLKQKLTEIRRLVAR